MKKVINGKLYDTEKATFIGRYTYSHEGDFNFLCQELYVTKSGNFFIAGEGGAMSRYASSTGQNSVSGGEDIEVLTKEEALAWAEEHLPVDEFEEHFDDIEEA